VSSGRVRLAIVGIGNPEVGDDGVGPALIRCLRSRQPQREGVLVTTLEGDLFGISEIVERADRILLVDAILAEPAGEVIEDATEFSPEARPVSQHQTDIVTVMRTLEALPLTEPFPPWSVWGVTITGPLRVGQDLNEVVRRGVESLCARLEDLLRELDAPS